MKYLLIFLLVLAIFVVSITLGAQNDQQVTFNYLLAQGRIPHLYAAGSAVCGWVRDRLADLWPVLAACSCFSRARAERKIKRLEHQLIPATDVPAATGAPAVKE